MSQIAKLNAWDMCAIEYALRLAISREEIHEGSGENLLERIGKAEGMELTLSVDRPLTEGEAKAARVAIALRTGQS